MSLKPLAAQERQPRRIANGNRNIEKRSEAENIVAPENHFDLAEVGFLQVGAFVDGAIVDAADFERQGIGLRSDQQIRAQAAKFARHAVAHFESHGESGGGDGHADHESRRSQNFAARIANEGLSHQAREHFYG